MRWAGSEGKSQLVGVLRQASYCWNIRQCDDSFEAPVEMRWDDKCVRVFATDFSDGLLRVQSPSQTNMFTHTSKRLLQVRCKMLSVLIKCKLSLKIKWKINQTFKLVIWWIFNLMIKQSKTHFWWD